MVGAIAVLIMDAALFGVLVVPLLRRRLGNGNERPPVLRADDLPDLASATSGADGVPVATYNRVVRFASWAYILFIAIFVGATPLWPSSRPAIFAILTAAGALVFLVHDVLPAGRLGRVKYLLESLIAVGLVTAIVVLTDGLTSPFFFAYPLVVAGAALVATPPVTFGLAALATAAYLVAAAPGVAGRPDSTAIAIAGINVAALVLLTYVAYVIAREQRRTRLAAIRLSTTDGLTGLANRSYVLLALEREIDRGIRYERGFCLLMADLDGLKAINDTFGHSVGDRVLVHVAQVIREGVRRIDIPARLSGDEFIVLLPETDPAGAFVVAEKVRQGVAALRLAENGEGIPVSVSIGVVAWPDAGSTSEMLMDAVDAAMYASKRQGRNQPVGPGGRARRDEPARPRLLPGPNDRNGGTQKPAGAAGPEGSATERHSVVVPIRGHDTGTPSRSGSRTATAPEPVGASASSGPA